MVLGWEIPHKDLLDETTLSTQSVSSFEGNIEILLLLSEQMEPPDVPPTHMETLGMRMQHPILLQVVLKVVNMLAAVVLVEALDFLVQEMVDMALAVVAMVDKILMHPLKNPADMDTWWYMADLEQSNYIDTL